MLYLINKTNYLHNFLGDLKMKTNKTDTDLEKSDILEDTKKSAKYKRVKASDKEGNFIIQNGDDEYSIGKIKELCIADYKGNTRKKVKTVDVYVKFDNGSVRAYYVINGKSDGSYIEL